MIQYVMVKRYIFNIIQTFEKTKSIASNLRNRPERLIVLYLRARCSYSNWSCRGNRLNCYAGI